MKRSWLEFVPLDQEPDLASGRLSSFVLSLRVSPIAVRTSGGTWPSRNGLERGRGRTTVEGTEGMLSVSRAHALKLILRRRFQGTVTKSARRAGWTGLCFPVMAELQ